MGIETERDAVDDDDVFLKENETCEEQATTDPDEFNFPRLFINVIREPKNFFGPNSDLFEKKYLVDHLILLSAFITFTLTFISGIGFFDSCHCGRTLCPLLIIQGASGLVIVAIQLFAVLFSWKPEKVAKYSENNRLAIKLLLLCSHVLIQFCIILFFIVQICIFAGTSYDFQELRTCLTYSNNGILLKIFAVAILVFHYITSIGYLYNCKWNRRRLLLCINRNAQDHLRNCDEDEAILDVENLKENICTV
ncbi:unnamed protein product [Adineta ricciae]|uniref:Uncharacterized protein n=1 Tax=Adineta ricciae TaxID=249248 RepID=A0A814UZG8_ADIRI|nr:unnamed protein product [Adineta ricciae]